VDELDEHGELRAVARDVARDPETGWKQWAELGWLSLLVAEERGGAGADERAAAAVARELGAAGRREPFVGAGVLTTALLAALPPSDAVDELLGAVQAGETLAVPAWQPESGALDAPVSAELGYSDHLRSRVRLAGHLYWVPTAEADAWLVAARAADGATALVRVEKDAPGLTVQPVPNADGTSQAHLRLADTPGTLLAPDAEAALRAAVDTAALIAAAELLGGIDTMLGLTRRYLTERTQFGRAIGGFQVLQHRAVDMWVQRELAEAALDGALRRAVGTTDPTTRARASSSAKSRASSAALAVAGDAVQLHGAIGFTEEYELGRYVNRAFVLAAALGNAREHITRHGRLVA
jgi:alkylation response protein AidB-like acyl-CoA dehydrogenase